MVSNRTEQDLVNSDLNQDFEQVVVPAVYRYLQSECYQEALETLNNFYRTKADRDENGWLKHKCDSWKALILEKQGKYWEALSLYKSLAQVMGAKHNLFTYLQVDVARVLHKIGNHQEAILEIEKALKEHGDNSISDKLTALNLYVNLLEECHETLAIQYQSLVKNLAHELGIKLREDECLDPINFSQLVKELTQKNQEANRRYSRMLIEYDEIEDDRQAESLLRKYVSQESVDYYRNLAMKELANIS